MTEEVCKGEWLNPVTPNYGPTDPYFEKLCCLAVSNNIYILFLTAH